jgi:hypothetical protein
MPHVADHDVAEMQADAEIDRQIERLGQRAIQRGHPLRHAHRGARGVEPSRPKTARKPSPRYLSR